METSISYLSEPSNRELEDESCCLRTKHDQRASPKKSSANCVHLRVRRALEDRAEKCADRSGAEDSVRAAISGEQCLE